MEQLCNDTLVAFAFFFSLFNDLIEMFILPSSLVPNSIFLSVFENADLLLIREPHCIPYYTQYIYDYL